MKQRDVVIQNQTGLHARPARFLVDVAKKFQAKIQLVYGEKRISAKSLIAMLTLGVVHGATLTIVADGVDEDEAIQALTDAIDGGLGEGAEKDHSNGTQPSTKPSTAVASINADADSITGVPVSPGIALGPVYQIRHTQLKIEDTFQGITAEKQRLEQALEEARQQLTELQKRVSEEIGSQEAEILGVHLALLEDTTLIDSALTAIEQQQNAAQAWQQTIETQAQAMTQLDDALLAARAVDLRDVGQRVLHLLLGIRETPFSSFEHPIVLVAEELTPSETATLDLKQVLGICTAFGSPTTHSSILARGLGVPAIVGLGPQILDVAQGTQVIVDGKTGQVLVNPKEEAIQQAQHDMVQWREVVNAARSTAVDPAVTTDKHRIEVVANISGVADAQQIVKMGGEGVGLLRTEFLFLKRETAPTEEEQFQIYRDIVQAVNGHPVIIRTLDIGGDKPLPYIQVPHEANPFLGERGLRLCLNRPELLRQQLRAIFRAAQYGRIRVMFPMVADLAEWRQASAIVEAVRAELNAPQIEVGIMVEVPSAALMADVFAPHVDFFSIGTNDLTQYTMAVDRMHPTLTHLSDGLHPAILRLVDTTVKAAQTHGKWVGVCGELAADPQAVQILLGLGVAELSVNVPMIPLVKSQIRSLSFAEMQTVAKKALQCATATDVRATVPIP